MIDKIKKINFIEVFILIMPFIDMLNTITGLSVSLYARGIFLVGLIFYFVFFNKSKIKKISYYLLVILAIFSVIYIYHYFTLNQTSNIINEITTLIKFQYLPVLTIILLNYYEEKELKIQRIMQRIILIYCISLILPTLLGIALKSYEYGKKGYTGLFYAPNEVSGILAIISPFIILNFQNNKKKILNFLLCIVFILTCFIIGTKAPIIGLAISLFAGFVGYITNYIKTKKDFINIIFCIVLMLFTIIIYKNSYLNYNLNLQSNNFDNNLNVQNPTTSYPLTDYEIFISKLDYNDRYINFPTKTYQENYINNKLLNLIFSNRNIFVFNNFNKYKNTILSKQLFGLTLKLNINESSSNNLSEIDFFDIFIYYGVIGFIVLAGYLIVLAFAFVIKYFKKFSKNIENTSLTASCISFAIALMIALLAGHTLSAPTVTTIIALIIVNIIKELKIKIKGPKMSIKIFSIIIFIFCILSITIITIFNNKIYTLNIKLDNNISFDKEVILVENQTINYENIKDELTYYIPSTYKNIQIIHVQRTLPSNNKIDFFTIANNENIKININIELNDNNTSITKNKNSTFIKGDKNYLISNSYFYNTSKENITTFNKYAIKILQSENADALDNKKIIKSITLKPNTYVDTYIITSENKLINKDELIPWISFNGIYNQIDNNVYAKNYEELQNYKSSIFTELLNYIQLINLYKYSNIVDNVWYQDYFYNTIDNYDNKYIDPTLNYNIFKFLNSIDNQNLYLNFANLLKEEYNSKNYITTSQGIIFNKIYNSSFKNQVSTLNILLKYYENNQDYQTRKIINSILSELTNSKWYTKDNNIFGYININQEYKSISTNVIDELLELKKNLEANDINSSKIDNYIDKIKEGDNQ